MALLNKPYYHRCVWFQLTHYFRVLSSLHFTAIVLEMRLRWKVQMCRKNVLSTTNLTMLNIKYYLYFVPQLLEPDAPDHIGADKLHPDCLNGKKDKKRTRCCWRTPFYRPRHLIWNPVSSRPHSQTNPDRIFTQADHLYQLQEVSETFHFLPSPPPTPIPHQIFHPWVPMSSGDSLSWRQITTVTARGEKLDLIQSAALDDGTSSWLRVGSISFSRDLASGERTSRVYPLLPATCRLSSFNK